MKKLKMKFRKLKNIKDGKQRTVTLCTNNIKLQFKFTYSFWQFDTMKLFAETFFTNSFILNDADEDRVELLIQIMDLKEKKSKNYNKEKKGKLIVLKLEYFQ